MKIIFYGLNGEAALERLTALRAEGTECTVIHAEACNEAIPCDEIEFMPDVSEWDCARLNALFGKESEAKTDDTDGGKTEPDPKYKIGKGPGGRIYIFDMEDGRKIYSGPFEADALAEDALKVVLASKAP